MTPVSRSPLHLLLRIALGLLVALLLAVAAGMALTWAPDRPVQALQQRWASAPSRLVPVLGMQVHLRDEGPRDDPQPIVLLHGTSASLHTWDGWVDALKTRRRVIRFDLPGFGLTGPHPQGRYDSAAYREFVLAMLDHLGVAECVLGGNSLGGAIAWNVAAHAPQRVARLILVDAAGYPLNSQSVPIGFQLARMPALAPVFTRTLPRSVVAASVRNVYGDPSRVSDALIDRYYELTLREGNRAALGQRMAQTQWGEDMHRIRGLQQPTLILWGGRDRLIPPEHGARFRREIIGSNLSVFNELGHVPHEEDPVATVARVKVFLGL